MFKKRLKEGVITNNPILVQQLGMCATMAITTTLFNGVGMGLSVLIILTCCNVVISAIRKIIPGEIRLAIFVVVIAGFVTIVDLLLQAFVPALSEALGVFIPLIVVNCIIIGRAEAFCQKNTVGASFFDGIFQGLGYTCVLIILTCCNVAVSAIRKIIPGEIRLAIFVVVIAGFVTIVDLLLQAFIPALSESLGVFIPLIVVNCIIIGRAEAFCQKNSVGASFIDGITQGLGYTVVLVVMCLIRELLGSGRFGGGLIDLARGITLDGTGAGIQIFSPDYGASILTLPVGGFLTLGFLFAAMQYALKKAAEKKEKPVEEDEDETEEEEALAK